MNPEPNKQFFIFERYLDVLLYAAHATNSFTVRDIRASVLDGGHTMIYTCLSNLVKSGYLKKDSATSYSATTKTKELFEGAA